MFKTVSKAVKTLNHESTMRNVSKECGSRPVVRKRFVLRKPGLDVGHEVISSWFPLFSPAKCRGSALKAGHKRLHSRHSSS
jgi:hypothetical protein